VALEAIFDETQAQQALSSESAVDFGWTNPTARAHQQIIRLKMGLREPQNRQLTLKEKSSSTSGT
jgi:hypothetical protein